MRAFYGRKETDPLATDASINVKQFVEGIVGARSRILHGTLSTLMENVDVRGTVEVLASTCYGAPASRSMDSARSQPRMTPQKRFSTVQTRRNKRAALNLMSKLLKKYGFVPGPVILGSQNATSVADGATIERRIRISQPDEGRGRCKGSRTRAQPSDFSQLTQPPIIPSTSNAISLLQGRTEHSGHRPCKHGVKLSRRAVIQAASRLATSQIG
jgi:hypothetical protein